MLYCPICRSTKWKEGICGKCGYRNSNPFGRVNTGFGKHQQELEALAQKKGFITIFDISYVYKKKDVKKETERLIQSTFFKLEESGKGTKLIYDEDGFKK